MASATIDVYVKLPTGKVVTFDLLPTDEVSVIVDRVSAELQESSYRVQLKYQGKPLLITRSLRDYGVCRETILKAEVVQHCVYTLHAKCTGESDTSVEINNADTVSSLKLKLSERMNTDANSLLLKMKRGDAFQMLTGADDEKSLLQCGIVNNETLLINTLGATSLDDKHKNELSQEEQQMILSSFDASGSTVDVVFAFDTTGSMYSCLCQVRKQLRDTITRLLHDVPGIRIGIMAVGDYCDHHNYIVRYIDLTSDVERLVEFAAEVPSTGGGDEPEAYEWALRKAQGMDWCESSAKAFVLIADSHPHPPSYTDQHINWREELDVLKAMGVKVYGIQAQSSTSAKPFYQQLADETGGCYINFSNFQLITHMFLAVCYNEASEEQFDAFCEEVEEQDPGSKQEAQQVMQQIKESSRTSKDSVKKHQHYVAEAWWDTNLDTGNPRFSYDEKRDVWKTVQLDITPTAATHTITHPNKKKSCHSKHKRRCSVM